MALYERIRELCYEKKISVRELEDQMGFSHGAIGKWNIHEPTYERLVKVADFFSVSPDYLKTGEKAEDCREDVLELAKEALASDPEDVRFVTDQLRRLKAYKEEVRRLKDV